MKKGWFLVAGLVLVLAMVDLAGCSPGNTITDSQQQGIWVTGEGKVTAVPDIATLSLGIEAEEASVAEAQAQATKAMNDVMTALTENGVDKKDIQTQYFSIQQVTKWDNDKQEQVVVGYQVTNTVTAKIRSLPQESFPLDYKAGRIIDAVAQAGGNLTRINSINFSIDDPSAYYKGARDKAMADANAKASQLAELAGVTLGKPTYISESTYVPAPVQRVTYEAKAAAPETPISPGEMEISVSVQVAYAIK